MPTREQMLNAIEAKSIQEESESEKQGVEETIRDHAWMEAYEDEGQYRQVLPIVQARFKDGKAVLDKYNLRFSGRNTVGSGADADRNSESYIVVYAGYIGTMQAYRTVSFHKKG